MAVTGVLDDDIQEKINNSKILLVGAGGIGCEVLKNLVLVGFKDIEVIDLDTIDVSNLNRQFLFHKQHVGQSKAEVARDSALQFNPDVNIVAIHDSITNPKYGVNYFKKFNVVLNALDNRAARNHVNRLCLASEVPLIESGTAGYYGQVELIIKGQTKCYECDPKQTAKTFPGCTIRNTPSEPIHCIVWAKHLFCQLFGEDDADTDVSPDTLDPSLKGDVPAPNVQSRVPTRLWAQNCQYDPEKLFTKFFNEDIKYLLKMSDLWTSRKPPQPLDWNTLPQADVESINPDSGQVLEDQKIWSISHCAKVFADSVKSLYEQSQKLDADERMTWDKDDPFALDFVVACTNIRAHIFNIPPKSKFDIKSMAGNIIPAIATTNAITAGLVVLYAMNVLRHKYEQCQSVYLRPLPNPRGLIIVPERNLVPPNPKCMVCASKPTATLKVNITKMTLSNLEEEVLKKTLNMVAPDATIDDNTGRIIISSEEDELSELKEQTLQEVGLFDQTRITVDDYLQNYTLSLIIIHQDIVENEKGFEVEAGDDVKPKEEEKTDENNSTAEDDELEVIETPMDVSLNSTPSGTKRKLPEESVPVKKRRHDSGDSLDCEITEEENNVNNERSTKMPIIGVVFTCR